MGISQFVLSLANMNRLAFHSSRWTPGLLAVPAAAPLGPGLLDTPRCAS